MLIDNVTIKVTSGKGGDGAVAFSKIKMTLGPTGARGGNGGDAYLEAVADLGALRHFRTRKSFSAENGFKGRSAFRDGHRGEDLILTVPRGTVVHNQETGTTQELINLGQRLLVAKGGYGGKGNFHFKSSINTSPKEFQPGLPGERYTLRLELKLIADIGLIGLPNVGKSSFLNELTNAKSRVANYAFTTLEPNLGDYYGLILADLPGLIEGASQGKGLGIKFLKHIERTRILFHFIDANSENTLQDYQTIRNELGVYNPALLEKAEYIFITKADTVDAKRLSEIKKILKSSTKDILTISIYDYESMTAARKILDKILESIKK